MVYICFMLEAAYIQKGTHIYVTVLTLWVASPKMFHKWYRI